MHQVIKLKEFKSTKVSYILDQTLVLPTNYDKFDSNDENILNKNWDINYYKFN